MSPSDLPDKPEQIDIQAQKPVSQRLVTREFSARFSGPLPPPGFLAEYEAAIPGAAERIIRMTEAEAEHRRAMERIVVEADVQDRKRESDEARRGQVCALFIVMASLGVGAYTAMNGHEVAGGILGTAGIGGIVTTFVLGRRISSSPQRPEPDTRD